MARQVNRRGQVTIERDARRRLGVRPGMVAVQVVVGDHLEIYFLPAPHKRSLFGALVARPAAPLNEEALEWTIEQSIARDAMEEANRE